MTRQVEGKRMYGARGRIGLLVPSVNTVVEPDFARIVPEGVGVYAARMRNGRGPLDAADLTSMCRHAERAADELGSARCGVLAFALAGCCTTSQSGGTVDTYKYNTGHGAYVSPGPMGSPTFRPGMNAYDVRDPVIPTLSQPSLPATPAPGP